MKPGSPGFRKALLSSLQQESCLQAFGPVYISAEERVSRNTVIYRCRMGPKRVIAKAQATKPAAVLVAEYQMLQDMRCLLPNRTVRGLQPVAVFQHLGVLVSEEETGDTLRVLVERACADREVGWAQATSAVKAAAKALRVFHDAYGRRAGVEATKEMAVRWYQDFSPKNLLIQWGSGDMVAPEVVLMDPPEEEKWGSRTEDIGVFCYDTARIRFLPRFIWAPRVSEQLDWFKAWFIYNYYQSLGDFSDGGVLREIKQAERRRASQALRWYMRPWRYASMLKETARLCYLGPLTATYRIRGVHRSYANVSRILRDEAAGWGGAKKN